MCCDIFGVTATSLGGWPGDEVLERGRTLFSALPEGQQLLAVTTVLQVFLCTADTSPPATQPPATHPCPQSSPTVGPASTGSGRR